MTSKVLSNPNHSAIHSDSKNRSSSFPGETEVGGKGSAAIQWDQPCLNWQLREAAGPRQYPAVCSGEVLVLPQHRVCVSRRHNCPH